MIVMSSRMAGELELFAQAFVWGMTMMLAYDGLSLLRLLFRHGTALLAVEDLCYWIFGAIYIFGKIFQENHGMIRSFVFMGILLGMLCYHQSISPVFISFFVKILRIPVKYISFGIKRLLFFIKRCSILIRRSCRRGHTAWKNKRLAGIENIKKKTKKEKAT